MHLVVGPLAQTSPGRQGTHTQHPCVVSVWLLGPAHSMAWRRIREQVSCKNKAEVRHTFTTLLQKPHSIPSARLCCLRRSRRAAQFQKVRGTLMKGGKALEEHEGLETSLWPSLDSATPASTEGTPCPTSAGPRQAPCLSAELRPNEEPGSGSIKPSLHQSVP